MSQCLKLGVSSTSSRLIIPSARCRARVSRATSKVFAMGLFGGLFGDGKPKKEGENDAILAWARTAKPGTSAAPSMPPEGQEVATFAMGCFWGPQLLFDRIEGVTETYVGYTQGNVANPTYEQVCSGSTNHTEGIQIYFDPQVVSYRSLIDTMLGHADPTTLNRQGNDRGTTYRSGIYYHSEEQRQIVEQVRDEVNAQLAAGTYRGKAEGREWVAEIKPAVEFWRAELYHQKYLENGGRFGRKQSANKGATDDIRCYG